MATATAMAEPTVVARDVEVDAEEMALLMMMGGNSGEAAAAAADWEVHKENVRPLKRGRNPNLLTNALNANRLPSHKLSLLAQRRRMIGKIDEYQGDDPLSPWIECIKWLQESFPSGGESSGLVVIYEQCVRTFWHDDRYKDDLRYLKVWLEYAANCADAEVIFSFLEANDIGQGHAVYYSSYANHMKSKNKLNKADEIFNLGIARKARPLEKLEAAYRSFLKQLTNKKHCEEDSTETSLTSRSFGTVLNRVDAGLNSTENLITSKSSGIPKKPESNRPFSVYRDEKSLPTLSCENAKLLDKSWQSLGIQSERNKENTTKPDKWASYKVPQKLPRRSAQNDSIEIYVDEELEELPPVDKTENPKRSLLKLRRATSQNLKKETELLKENPLRNFPLKRLR